MPDHALEPTDIILPKRNPGQWLKGQCGNPLKVQTNPISGELRRLNGAKEAELLRILSNPRAKMATKHAADLHLMAIQGKASEKLKAKDILLDRTEGKPMQSTFTLTANLDENTAQALLELGSRLL